MLEFEPLLVSIQLKGLLELLGCKMTPILPAQLLLFLLTPLSILVLGPELHLLQPQLIGQKAVEQLQVKDLLISYFK